MGILITKNNIGQNRVIRHITNIAASPFQLTQRDTNKLLTNKGATAEVFINLPVSPVIGQIFEAICLDADNMKFVAQGSQKIRLGNSLSVIAGYCELSGIGTSIEIVYIDTNLWVIVD